MRPAVRGLVAAVIGAVLLSGCLRVESSFDIAEDGTADMFFEIAFKPDVLEQFGELLGQPLGDLEGMSPDDLFSEIDPEGGDPCADITESIPDYGVEKEDISTDGEIGVKCTVRDVPIGELVDLGDDSSLAISQSDGITTFEMELSGVSEAFGGEEEIELPGFDPEDLVEFTVRASAPGTLADNNATSTDGSTAVWELAPDAEFVAGDTATMSARWEPGSDSSNSWIIIVVIAVVVAIAAAILVIVLRGRGGSKGQPSGDLAAPPPPPPGGAATSGGMSAPPGVGTSGAGPPPPPPRSGTDLPPPPGP